MAASGISYPGGLPPGIPDADAIALLEQRMAAAARAAPLQAQASQNLRTGITRPLVTPEHVQHLPGPLQPVGMAARELTSPAMIAATLLTAAAGPVVAGGIRGGTGAAGAARGLLAGAVEPVGGSFAARVAADAAIGTGFGTAMTAAGEVLPENTPGYVRVPAQAAAGLAGGAAAFKAPAVLRRAVPPEQIIYGTLPSGEQVALRTGQIGEMKPGQYGFGGEIVPPRPAQVTPDQAAAEGAPENFALQGHPTTPRLSEETAQAGRGKYPAGRLENEELFYGNVDPATGRTAGRTLGARDKDPFMPLGRGYSAGPVPVQPRLTTPRGETLSPSGTLDKPLANIPMPRPPGVDAPRPDIAIPGLERPPVGDNPIGLVELSPGLTRGEKMANRLLGVAQRGFKQFRLNDEVGTVVTRDRSRLEPRIISQGTQLAHNHEVRLRDAFKGLMDAQERIPSLAGVDPRVPGAPTLADVAARFPSYSSRLSPRQRTAIFNAVLDIDEYKELLGRVGVGVDTRADIRIGRGFYLPRVTRGHVEQSKVTPAMLRHKGMIEKVKKGFEEEAHFESQAAGMDAGYKYASIGEALRYHFIEAGQRAMEAHHANFLLKATDDTGWPISIPRKGESGALRRGVALPGLSEYSFPDVLADSINKVIIEEGPTIGAGRNAIEAVRILNRSYRAVRASLDSSAHGVQLLLSAYANPTAAAKAASVGFRAWRDPRVLVTFKDTFDRAAASKGLLSSKQWVSEAGLVQQATSGEFAVEGLQKVWGFRHSQRAFGFAGDAARLTVAQELLEQEMRGFSLFGKNLVGKGRTLDEIRASGDLARIGEIANNMTGVARQRFGGEIGEILFFAPRFLQARLETLGRAMLSFRPGATLDQRIARRSLLKMLAVGTSLTVALNEMNGEETDFRPLVNGRWNPNFMRVRAFGRDWSLFGTWDSLARMIVAAGHADAVGVIRGQGSGLVTLIGDQLAGETITGEPVGNAPELRATHVLRSLAPFSGPEVAGGLEQVAQGDVGGIAAAGGAVLGLKSSPENFADRADQIAREQYGTTWSALLAGRRKALDAAVETGRTTSLQYEAVDRIVDKISEQVTAEQQEEQGQKRFPFSNAARRDVVARDLYGEPYDSLFPNQKVKVNAEVQRRYGSGVQRPGDYPNLRVR